MKLYHCTSTENAEKIMKKGIHSHSWFASTIKRAKEYAELNKNWKKESEQCVLVFSVPKKEIEERSMVKEVDADNQTEFMLHSYKMPKLKPIKVIAL